MKLKGEQYSGIAVFLCELADLSPFMQILTLLMSKSLSLGFGILD